MIPEGHPFRCITCPWLREHRELRRGNVRHYKCVRFPQWYTVNDAHNHWCGEHPGVPTPAPIDLVRLAMLKGRPDDGSIIVEPNLLKASTPEPPAARIQTEGRESERA